MPETFLIILSPLGNTCALAHFDISGFVSLTAHGAASTRYDNKPDEARSAALRSADQAWLAVARVYHLSSPTPAPSLSPPTNPTHPYPSTLPSPTNPTLPQTRSAQLPHPSRVSCSDLFLHGKYTQEKRREGVEFVGRTSYHIN